MAGELTTANYGWVKPTVGASIDAWGGYLNADLDGIDSTVKGVSNAIPAVSTATPQMDGTAAPGSSGQWADGAHVHPTDTSRAAASALTSYAPLASPALTGNPTAPTPTAGDNDTSLATTAFVTTAVAAQPVAMNDNRIINGNFAINQRAYVSGTALATTVYGHDRWKAGPSGCTYTFTAVLPDTTITITANTLTQVIEAGMIEGGVYTLSWTGTAQARVYQGAPTGSYTASPVTTASLTAGTNTIIEFNAGTVARAKFEIGSIATLFNRQSLAKNLADCQRYFQSISQCGNAGYMTAGTSVGGGSIVLPVTMRAAPTAGLGTPAYGNASALATSNLNADQVRLQCTVTATGYYFAFAAPLTLTAEL